jgi:DNA-binding protein H-NS
MLDVVGQERVASLKKAIHEIKQLVEERKKLSLEFIKEGEELKSEINNLIIGNESTLRALGQNEALIEKNALRNKKVEISELQLNEKINCWKDIALLKKELRIYEKELSEKEGRIKELNDILSEGD